MQAIGECLAIASGIYEVCLVAELKSKIEIIMVVIGDGYISPYVSDGASFAAASSPWPLPSLKLPVAMLCAARQVAVAS